MQWCISCLQGCQNQRDTTILCWTSCWFHLDMLVVFIKTHAKNKITFGLPPLCLMIENGFNCHRISDWKILVTTQLAIKFFWSSHEIFLVTIGFCDWIFLVTIGLAIKMWLIILWWLNIFGYHSCGDWKLLVVNLAITKSFLSPILWWRKTFCHQSCGDRIFSNCCTYGD